jgi:NAD(P)-dependent dehydrogenase (short-subunit alcohol dehydrogenase family)
MSTWLITGCSTGLGRHLAEAALNAGHNVVVTARDLAKVQDLVDAYPRRRWACPRRHGYRPGRRSRRAGPMSGSVRWTCSSTMPGTATRAAVEEGRGGRGAPLFATNFFGASGDDQRPCCPGCGARRGGAIVNISSSVRRSVLPGSGYYAASKAPWTA